MQIVSWGDNLHKMQSPIFWKKKNKKIFNNLLSAKFAQRMLKVEYLQVLRCKNMLFSLFWIQKSLDVSL